MLSEDLNIRDGILRPSKRFLMGPSAAVTGRAPVQAIPTTAAQWAIINNAAADANAERSTTGNHIFIEDIGMYLTSGTPGQGGSLWGCLFTAPVTGTSDAGMTTQNAHGGPGTSNAVIKSAITISTPAAPTWFLLDFSWNTIAPAAFSTGYNNPLAARDQGGRISIAPGTALGLAVVAPAGTTPLYAPFARWTEQRAAVS
jgi:hypothetical protein